MGAVRIALLDSAAVRMRLPHCGHSRQIVAGILRSEDGFAGFGRREDETASLRPFPANDLLTAAILGKSILTAAIPSNYANVWQRDSYNTVRTDATLV